MDDEYFRAFLIRQDAVSNNPVAQHLNDHISKKIEKGEGLGFLKYLQSQVYFKRLITPAGIDLGLKPFQYAEYSRIDKSLKKIIKGIFFHLAGQPLPSSHRIAVVDVTQAIELADFLKLNLARFATELSTQSFDTFGQVFAFRCFFSKPPQDPPISVWEIVFFERRSFFAVTYPDCIAPPFQLLNPDPNETSVFAL